MKAPRGITQRGLAVCAAALVLVGCVPIPIPRSSDSPTAGLEREIVVGQSTAKDAERAWLTVKGHMVRYPDEGFTAYIAYRRKFSVMLLPLPGGSLVWADFEGLGVTIDEAGVVTHVERVVVKDFNYDSVCCGVGPLPELCFSDGHCWRDGVLTRAPQP